MALIYIKDVCSGVRLGMWRMDEEPVRLLAAYPHLHTLAMPCRNKGRLQEMLSVRALLAEMTGDTALEISHEPSGRPVVQGWHVSISHTRGYAVLALSPCRDVGVDVEYRSGRVVKIAPHFIRPDEQAYTAQQMLVLWCAKETLYKLHSSDRLHYFDMRCQGLPDAGCHDWSGEVALENMKRGAAVQIHVELTADYCLTWAV